MNPDKIKITQIRLRSYLSRSIFYVCYCRSSPETFKNLSTGLKLTKIRLDLVEESRDQVKIEGRMTH